MQHEGAFDFGSTQAVTRDVKHVIHATGDSIIAILITTGTVSGEVVAGVGFKIGINHALMVTIHTADLARPGRFNDKVACARPFDFDALFS